MIEALVNHLWQSSLFVLLISVLVYVFRNNSAGVRYWLWFAASAKFLVPFALFAVIGNAFIERGQIEVAPLDPDTSNWLSIGERIAEPMNALVAPSDFPSTNNLAAPAPQITPSPLAWYAVVKNLFVGLWLAGALLVFGAWLRQWRRLKNILSSADNFDDIDFPVPVKMSSSKIEPGVIGIFRPVLLLPQGIAQHLNHAQVAAILEHERQHLRRWDNLTAAIHMLAAGLFWFNPLIWWVGSRLVEERERACDEAVLKQGNDARNYAEGILNVCEYCLNSPLLCASGVSGADLNFRVKSILSNKSVEGLHMMKKLLLVALSVSVLALPMVLGVVNPTKVQAQNADASDDAPRFASSTVSLGQMESMNKALLIQPQGGMRIRNWPMTGVIAFAYNVQQSQVEAPEWVNQQALNIDAVGSPSPDLVATPGEVPDLVRARLRQLLIDKFGLVAHKENDVRPVLALTLRDGEHALVAASDTDRGPLIRRLGANVITGTKLSMNLFVSFLGKISQQAVVDQTGLEGNYNFTLQWTADPNAGPGQPPTLANVKEAVTQLGLSLDEQSGDVEILIVDQAQLPDTVGALHKEVIIGQNVFDRYIGHYELSQGRVMTIFRDQNKFFAQISGQAPTEIFAENETAFFSKDADTQFTFTTDDGGRATSLTMNSGGVKVKLKALDEDTARTRIEKILAQMQSQLQAAKN